MPTLIDNLNLINSYKSDIKSAIENKGVDMTGVSFGSYADKIGEIETGGTFVTETLSVSVNNTYYPGAGVDGFSQVIVDVPQSVTGYTEKEITEETYAIYNLNNSASFVHRNVFEADVNLLTVNLPNASYVGSEAFKMCSNLTSVELATCETIYTSAFHYCSKLSYCSAPNVKFCGMYAFNSCSKLETISFPLIESVQGYCFQNCYALSQAYFDKCSQIWGSTFTNCSSLTQISIPNVLWISSAAFVGCTNLASIVLPRVSSIYVYAFSGCGSLSYLDIPVCYTIYGNAFNNCNRLESISAPLLTMLQSDAFYNGNNTVLSVLDMPNLYYVYNRGLGMFKSLKKINLPIMSYFSNPPTMAYLEEMSYGNKTYYVPSYVNAFGSIDIQNCSIYVDAAMYDKWVSATGWSSLSAAFVSIGDPNEPMLSLSDGLLYGKTEVIFSTWHSELSMDYTSVTEVSLPNCRLVVDNVFNGYSNITGVSLPECNVIKNSAFKGCTNLTSIDLPKCKFILMSTFQNCSKLSYVNLPECEYIAPSAFYTYTADPSYHLDLILGNSYVTTVDGSIIDGSQRPKTSIFVPASLVDAYKSVLSLYSDRIFPIPEP